MSITRHFKEFFRSEKLGGIVLLGCTIFSLVIANFNSGEEYIAFWNRYLNLSVGSVELNYSIGHWINDGLMTIFFLLVGLEIEREIYLGELSGFRNAVLPIGAAAGGMLIPAAIHFLLNSGTNTEQGFGIPMATDIAFTLGMLSLAGNRVPFSLKIFLTALAIIDDLGAILVIAVFYNSGISLANLGLALGIFVLLMIFNKTGIKNLLFYLLPGIVMWFFMLKSGVHATITGVLLAIAVPFSKNEQRNPSYLLQHALHKPVAFIILPVFALANTGIILQPGWMEELVSRNSLGIIFGLVAGKPLGILAFSWILIRLKFGLLPAGVNWKLMWGAAILAGIGFTMSIFISNLAFTDMQLIRYSKIAVLTGSLLATILGLAVLFTSGKTERSDEPGE